MSSEEGKKVQFVMEFCTSWGYYPRAMHMQRAMEKEFPGKFNFVLRGGRPNAFEITINGQLVHSKLANRSWPQVPNIIAAIHNGYEATHPGVTQAEEEEAGCVIC